MTTYRLVAEDDWKRAIEAAEALAKALKQAGTVVLPGATPSSTETAQRSIRGRRQGKDRTKLAKQVIERVNAGGSKHEPKIFDRSGPRIADFVYALTNSSFTVPEIIDTVAKYVALKESRRDAGGQIRTAIRNDPRFGQDQEGRYSKKNEAASDKR